MKKKNIIIIIAVVIVVLMLIPVKFRLKDGGSVEYRALLYKYTKIHRLNENSSTGYDDGWKLDVLWIHVADKIDKHDNNDNIKIYKKSIDDITLSLNLPNDWKYEELKLDKEEDFYKYALKIYKNDENKYAVLYYYYESYGTCGTGKTFKKIDLDNGKKATVGYYYGTDNWEDISFEEMNENIAIINHELNESDAKEFIDFVKTINIVKKSIESKNVSLYLKSLTSKGATLAMKNNTDKEYEYGVDWYIEYKENDNWKELETITGEPLVWNAIAYVIKPNEAKELNIDWSYGYGELKKGTYRLVKEVFKSEDKPIDDSKIIKLYAEFEIR